MPAIVIKRIYDEASKNDGYRILVDRIWPRDVSKEKATLDQWNKEIAPTTELRKWFNHKKERFEEFAIKYKEELHMHGKALDDLRKIAQTKQVTLLYAAKDEQCNQAIVLRNVLNSTL